MKVFYDFQACIYIYIYKVNSSFLGLPFHNDFIFLKGKFIFCIKFVFQKDGFSFYLIIFYIEFVCSKDEFIFFIFSKNKFYLKFKSIVILELIFYVMIFLKYHRKPSFVSGWQQLDDKFFNFVNLIIALLNKK